MPTSFLDSFLKTEQIRQQDAATSLNSRRLDIQERNARVAQQQNAQQLKLQETAQQAAKLDILRAERKHAPAASRGTFDKAIVGQLNAMGIPVDEDTFDYATFEEVSANVAAHSSTGDNESAQASIMDFTMNLDPNDPTGKEQVEALKAQLARQGRHVNLNQQLNKKRREVEDSLVTIRELRKKFELGQTTTEEEQRLEALQRELFDGNTVLEAQLTQQDGSLDEDTEGRERLIESLSPFNEFKALIEEKRIRRKQDQFLASLDPKEQVEILNIKARELEGVPLDEAEQIKAQQYDRAVELTRKSADGTATLADKAELDLYERANKAKKPTDPLVEEQRKKFEAQTERLKVQTKTDLEASKIAAEAHTQRTEEFNALLPGKVRKQIAEIESIENEEVRAQKMAPIERQVKQKAASILGPLTQQKLAVNQSKAELVELQQTADEMAIELGEDHEEVIQLRSTIESTEADLAIREQAIATQENLNGANLRELESQISLLDARSAQLREKAKKSGNELNALQQSRKENVDFKTNQARREAESERLTNELAARIPIDAPPAKIQQAIVDAKAQDKTNVEAILSAQGRKASGSGSGDPFALGRAVGKAIDNAAKNSGIGAIDPKTGQVNLQSILERNPRDTDVFIRLLQTQADSQPALRAGLQPLIDDLNDINERNKAEKEKFQGLRESLPPLTALQKSSGVESSGLFGGDLSIEEFLENNPEATRRIPDSPFTASVNNQGNIEIRAKVNGEIVRYELRGSGSNREWILVQ